MTFNCTRAGRRLGSTGRGRGGTLLVGSVLVVALALLRIADPGPFAALRNQVFDAFQRFSPRPYADAPVRVVDIDEASLARIGQWPWPRDVMAEMTDRLRELGAAAIAFDVVFPEPDRTSPHRMAADLRSKGFAIPPGLDLPDNDRIFARSLAEGRTVTGFALTAEDNGAEPVVRTGIAVLGDDPAAGLRAFPGATVNLKMFEEAAAGNGNFAIAAADARTVRALPLIAVKDGRIVPSLSLEALRVAQGAGTIVVRGTDGGTASLAALSRLTLRVGGLEVPLGADGSYPIHFTRPAPERMIPAWQVLDETSGLAADAVAGRIVLVGSSAVGMSDLRPTPLNPFEPGVAIHAAAIEQIVLGQHLQRPIFAPAAELAAGVLCGLAVLLLVAFAPLPLAVLGTLGMLAGAGFGAFHLFESRHLLIDPVPALLSGGLTFLAAILSRIILSEREKRRLRHAFGHYLSPDMVRQLAANPERLRLGGETREMTFLFTDLEGFTSFTESVEPEVLVRVLNDYLAEMCRIVTSHGGTIDKIVGDAVHAMFNAPLDQSDHADRAVTCALAISAFSDAFAKARQEEGLTIGITRIGINTGPAVVGNFGGAGRFDYTAHGDAINTAARLEAANKRLGTRICVSASTAQRCAGQRFRPIGTLMLKGKASGVEAFEPLAAATQAHPGYVEAFKALAHAGAEGGRAMLAYAAAHPEDSLARFHSQRVENGLAAQAIVLA